MAVPPALFRRLAPALWLAGGVLSAPPLLAGETAAGLPPMAASYAASETLLINGEAQDLRVFHTGLRERREGHDGGLSSILILRGDKGYAFILQPETRMAATLVDSDPEAAPDLRALHTLPARVVGTETLAGLAVTHYRVEGRYPAPSSPPPGPAPTPGAAVGASAGAAAPAPAAPPPRGFTGDVWSTADGIYVQVIGTVSEGGADIAVRLTLSDIRPGPQPDQLFELPSGYKVMNFGPIDSPLPPGLRDDGGRP